MGIRVDKKSTLLFSVSINQNKKIGTTLLNKIISKKDFNRIQLITESKDKEFYLKNGFIEDGAGIFKIQW